MTVDEIRKHPIFRSLGSDQLRKFIEEMVANGFDKVPAAKVAWGSEKEASSRSQADRALRHPGVKRLIALAQGRLTREEHLITLTTRAHMTEDPAVAFKYLELIAKIEGWMTKPAENPEPAKGDEMETKSLHELALEIESKQ